MNKNYERDKASWPQTGLVCVDEAGPVTIWRQEFKKQTERQSYPLTWYVVLLDGVEKGYWKSMVNATAQRDRLLNPKRRGRPKKNPDEAKKNP